MARKLRIGILLERRSIPAWAYLMLEKIKNGGDAEISVVIISRYQDGKLKKPAFLIKKTPLLFNAYQFLNKFLPHSESDALVLKKAHLLFKDIPSVKITPLEEENQVRYSFPDVAAIRNYGLDILLNLSEIRPTGAILKVTRFGTWWLDSTVPRYKGISPAGFWEVFENQPVSGVALYQLDRQENESILYASFSATDPLSVRGNCNRVYWKAASFVPRVVRQLRFTGELKIKQYENSTVSSQTDSDTAERTALQPLSNMSFARQLTGYLLHYSANRLEKVLFRTHWHLFYGFDNLMKWVAPHQESEFSMINTHIEELIHRVPPRNAFWSDPFVIHRRGIYYLFFEEFTYSDKKGHISILSLDRHGEITGARVALEKPYHLSYPFVFEWEGTYYMIPETAAQRRIEVYRCVDFPDRWDFYTILMENVSAVDTTLFCYQGKWWMFTNMKENEGVSSWDELFLFYADQPLTKNWRPHPLNPVVSDVRKARPAGTPFELGGILYRPSQDSSHGYGYGLNMNRVYKLNEFDYAEETLYTLKPDKGHALRGFHSFNHADGIVVVDAKLRRIRLPSLV